MEGKELTDEDLKEVGDFFRKRYSLNIKEKDILWAYDEVIDWIKGKRAKRYDYKACLRNWIKRDIREGKIKPASVSAKVVKKELPELTDEQRTKNLSWLKEQKAKMLGGT
jgi:hypothetical protein